MSNIKWIRFPENVKLLCFPLMENCKTSENSGIPLHGPRAQLTLSFVLANSSYVFSKINPLNTDNGSFGEHVQSGWQQLRLHCNGNEKCSVADRSLTRVFSDSLSQRNNRPF